MKMKQLIVSPVALGVFVKRVRKAKNLTQQEAGLAFGLDQTTISSIEQGANGTRVETIFRVLAALGLEMVVQEKDPQNSNQGSW